MNKVIYLLSDAMSRPIAFIALTGATILAIAFGAVLQVPEGYWMTLNLAISVTTMAIGQAVLVSSRRDTLAMHLKLDHTLEALPRDNSAIGAEHEDEETIERKLTATEERTAE